MSRRTRGDIKRHREQWDFKTGFTQDIPESFQDTLTKYMKEVKNESNN